MRTQPEPPFDKRVVILNPASGSNDDDFRKRLEKSLQERGAKWEIWETTPDRGGKALAEQAKSSGVRELVVCGGDGTVMSVVNGLGPSADVTLSIIPGGTANLLATALKIPTEPEEAVAVAFEGVLRELDLGRRDETLFALGVGVGLTERLISQASSDAKEKLGRWAYLFAMLKELGARPHRFELKLDDKPPIECRGVAIVLVNVGEIGNGMRFAPDARPDDGLLDLCVLHRFHFRDLFHLAFHAWTGRLKQDRQLTFHQARKIEVAANPPLEVQIDGEPVDAKTPIQAEILPRALRVRVPQDAPTT